MILEKRYWQILQDLEKLQYKDIMMESFHQENTQIFY